MVYLPVMQMEGAYLQNLNLHVRTAGGPLELAPAIRQLVRETPLGIPVMGVTTLDDVVARSLVQERLTAALASCCGALALLLAAVGMSGVLSNAVTRRTNEIGIRLALGARRSDVIGMIVRESLRLVAVGIAIGVPCAVAASKAAHTLLFSLTPADPVTLALAVAALGALALVAAYWPARRASRVDPVVALRCE